MTVLAVIPARGGSKRIPGKNIRPFLGVPLLARAAAILHCTGVFDRIVVSTDDESIAEVARQAGCDVPFRRPAELAGDHTGTGPVIAHAIRALEAAGERYSYVCCVYPAAVLVRPGDYRAALAELKRSGADYVFTAVEFPYPIQRALRSTEGGHCEMIWPEHYATRSQDLEPTFHDAGQFYFGRRAAWLEERRFFTGSSTMHLLPRARATDIDTLQDWEHAELLYGLLAEDGSQ